MDPSCDRNPTAVNSSASTIYNLVERSHSKSISPTTSNQLPVKEQNGNGSSVGPACSVAVADDPGVISAGSLVRTAGCTELSAGSAVNSAGPDVMSSGENESLVMEVDTISQSEVYNDREEDSQDEGAEFSSEDTDSGDNIRAEISSLFDRLTKNISPTESLEKEELINNDKAGKKPDLVEMFKKKNQDIDSSCDLPSSPTIPRVENFSVGAELIQKSIEGMKENERPKVLPTSENAGIRESSAQNNIIYESPGEVTLHNVPRVSSSVIPTSKVSTECVSSDDPKETASVAMEIATVKNSAVKSTYVDDSQQKKEEKPLTVDKELEPSNEQVDMRGHYSDQACMREAYSVPSEDVVDGNVPETSNTSVTMVTTVSQSEEQLDKSETLDKKNEISVAMETGEENMERNMAHARMKTAIIGEEHEADTGVIDNTAVEKSQAKHANETTSEDKGSFLVNKTSTALEIPESVASSVRVAFISTAATTTSMTMSNTSVVAPVSMTARVSTETCSSVATDARRQSELDMSDVEEIRLVIDRDLSDEEAESKESNAEKAQEQQDARDTFQELNFGASTKSEELKRLELAEKDVSSINTPRMEKLTEEASVPGDVSLLVTGTADIKGKDSLSDKMSEPEVEGANMDIDAVENKLDRPMIENVNVAASSLAVNSVDIEIMAKVDSFQKSATRVSTDANGPEERAVVGMEMDSAETLSDGAAIKSTCPISDSVQSVTSFSQLQTAAPSVSTISSTDTSSQNQPLASNLDLANCGKESEVSQHQPKLSSSSHKLLRVPPPTKLGYGESEITQKKNPLPEKGMPLPVSDIPSEFEDRLATKTMQQPPSTHEASDRTMSSPVSSNFGPEDANATKSNLTADVILSNDATKETSSLTSLSDMLKITDVRSIADENSAFSQEPDKPTSQSNTSSDVLARQEDDPIKRASRILERAAALASHKPLGSKQKGSEQPGSDIMKMIEKTIKQEPVSNYPQVGPPIFSNPSTSVTQYGTIRVNRNSVNYSPASQMHAPERTFSYPQPRVRAPTYQRQNPRMTRPSYEYPYPTPGTVRLRAQIRPAALARPAVHKTVPVQPLLSNKNVALISVGMASSKENNTRNTTLTIPVYQQANQVGSKTATLRPTTPVQVIRPKVATISVKQGTIATIRERVNPANDKVGTSKVFTPKVLGSGTINIDSCGVHMITELIARKNPLPVYKPPPIPANIKNVVSEQVYPCYECGDSFYLKKSLIQHQNRYSMRINYKCEMCNFTIKTFLNKCQLLNHLRNHMNISKDMAVPIHIKSDSIQITSALPDFASGKHLQWLKCEAHDVDIQDRLSNGSNSQQKTTTSLPSASTATSETGKYVQSSSTSQSNSATLSLQAKENAPFLLKPAIVTKHISSDETILIPDEDGLNTGKGDGKIRQPSICPECVQDCKTVSGMKEHMCPSSPQILDFSLTCNKCNMILPTPCSLKAHKRIHAVFPHGQKNVYVCPECGMFFDSNESKFFHHIKSSCWHTSRVSVYICTKCCRRSYSNAEMRSHIMSRLQQYQKCMECPMAFKTWNNLKTHFKEVHSKLPSSNSSKVIYRCHVCDTLIDDRNFLGKHVDSHILESSKKAIFGWACPVCFTTLNSKQALKLHLTKIHPKYSPQSLKCSCGVTSLDNGSSVMHILYTHGANFNYEIKICEHCGLVCHNVKAFESHQCSAYPGKTGADLQTFKCPYCTSKFGREISLSKHMVIHRFGEELSCDICHENDFPTYASYRSHVILCEATDKSSKKALEEGKKSSGIVQSKGPSPKLKNHSQVGQKNVKKPGETSVEVQRTKTVVLVRCNKCDKVFRSHDELNVHKDSEHGQHPCHLCGLMYESLTNLKIHIKKSHEGKKCVYFCSICRRRNVNRTFTNQSMLEKHLRRKHRLKKYDESLITMEYPDSEEPPTGVKSKRPLEAVVSSESPMKKLRVDGENKFNCAKCVFTCEGRDSFLEHIKAHAVDKAVQCLECGLSFAVLPSLRKHLFMVHKIKDFESYLTDNGIEEIKEEEEVEMDTTETVIDVGSSEQKAISESEDDLANPLECQVCYKVFDAEAAMKSHMRTHGMAFIKRTRRRALGNGRTVENGKRVSESSDCVSEKTSPERSSSVDK